MKTSVLTCQKCNHKWKSRTKHGNPKQCPLCNTRNWQSTPHKMQQLMLQSPQSTQASETPSIINPTTGKQENQFKEPLTVYYSQEEAILQNIKAIWSDETTSWMPGNQIKTTQKTHLTDLLGAIKKGFLSPEDFCYIECFPTNQLVYTYDMEGKIKAILEIMQGKYRRIYKK